MSAEEVAASSVVEKKEEAPQVEEKGSDKEDKKEKEKNEKEKEEKKQKKEKEKREKKEVLESAVQNTCWPAFTVDVLQRDPKELNRHVHVEFEDIIAEPDPTVFSFDQVWTVSYKVFTLSKLWCYRILSVMCAVPAAFCWGLEFAVLSFCTIWCWQPRLRSLEIEMFYVRRIIDIMLKVFYEPCFHAMGKCLSHIVVNVRRDA